MRAAILYDKGDVRFEERADPTLIKPTDALIRMSATCVCGSDLWAGVQSLVRSSSCLSTIMKHG